MQLILDAAEDIMIQDGYQAATLKAISERTGIPTASIYHYFLDRYQVDMALVLRHIDGLNEEVMASLRSVTTETSMRALVSAVLDPMVDYFREHPSCIELWSGRRIAHHDDVVRLFDEATARHVHGLAIDLGQLREDTPVLVALIAFEVGTHLFDVAFRRRPGHGDDDIFVEARLLISRYLKAYAPERNGS